MLDVIQSLELKNILIKDSDYRDGWPEKGPFNTILIANEIEKLNNNILNQLKIGGRLLVPIGADWAHVIFEIVERQSEIEFKKTALRENFFIPNPKVIPKVNTDRFSDNKIVDSIKSVAIPFESIEKYPIDSLLERAIGVIYRPQTERMSHYFHALLPSQFDEYIFFNTTKAIKPLSDSTFPSKTLLEHPFGFIDS